MRSLRRACLCLLLRYYIRADDLDEEDLFDLDGEGDYEDPESYIEYDQALYYDGPDDYYDGIEQFNMEDMADYPGEVSPELLEKIFGENPASGDELDALFEELGWAPRASCTRTMATARRSSTTSTPTSTSPPSNSSSPSWGMSRRASTSGSGRARTSFNVVLA